MNLEGRKKGVTTTLPLALGKLQEEGEIRRIPTNGLLDQQRYRYALWRPNPLSSNSVKANKAAVEQLKRVDVGEGRLMLPEDRDAFEKVPRAKRAAPPTHGYGGTGGTRKIAGGVGVKDLPSLAIVDRGRLIGLWEYDPDSSTIAWRARKPMFAINWAMPVRSVWTARRAARPALRRSGKRLDLNWRRSVDQRSAFAPDFPLSPLVVFRRFLVAVRMSLFISTTPPAPSARTTSSKVE